MEGYELFIIWSLLISSLPHLDLCFIDHQSIRQKRSFPWQTDLFEDSIRAAGIQEIEIGTKLHISNLDYGVTNDDIRV